MQPREFAHSIFFLCSCLKGLRGNSLFSWKGPLNGLTFPSGPTNRSAEIGGGTAGLLKNQSPFICLIRVGLYSVDTKGHDYEDVWITDQVIWKWRPGNGTKAFRGTAFWGLFPLIPVLACPHKPPLVQLARLWSVRLTMSPSQDCKLRQLDTKYEMEQNNIWGSFLCLERTVCVHNYWENLLRCLFDSVEFLVFLLGGFWDSFPGHWISILCCW